MKTNINEKAFELGNKRSTIREIFEYSKKRSAEIGKEKVFDFSIGNPSVAPPIEVQEAIAWLNSGENQTSLHGYTSAQGDGFTRQQIADNLNLTSKAKLTANNIYLTCGAAASLCISLKCVISNPSDEVIVIAPYFPEYRVFIDNMGGRMVEVQSEKDTFKIDYTALEKAINKNTKAVIINSPNNPSGVKYSEKELKKLGVLLKEKSVEFDCPIYLISDEPYREIVYDGEKTPNTFNFYNNVLMCYSYSKALSLAGERIGYVAVSPKMPDGEKVYLAICGSARSLGYVCAPSMFQQVISLVGNKTVDVSVYQKNRDTLVTALTKFGYTVVKPQGAFYLFVKAVGKSAAEFCSKAKEFELLLVPSDDFGVGGYVRLAYCKTEKEIENSLPAFEAFAKSLDLYK
ncbi:MAG: pyridoxal phosphate-dependent aminotransferase [Clostridia bacterium]